MKKIIKYLNKNIKLVKIFCLVLTCMALCFIGVQLDFKIINTNDQQNIVNTIAQIQITLASLIITMMSITTTLLNEDIYGIKLKDLLKLRKGIVLTLLSTVIILLIFTSLTVIAMIFNLIFFSFILLFLTLVICLWISIQDLPLCFKSDKAIIKLIKNNKNISTNGLMNSEIYNVLVLNLACNKKLDKVYKLLKSGIDKELLDYLFNLIINKMTNIKNFSENKIEYDKFVDDVLENVSLLLNQNSEVFKDYNDSNKMSVYLARILYYINNSKQLLDKTTYNKFEMVFSSLFRLLLIKEENIQKDIVFKTYQQMLYWSLKNCDLWVVKLLKNIYSSWRYTFANYKLPNILFSEISFVLFYYYQYEDLITKDKKEEILNFINNEEIISATERSYSWKSLFVTHLNNYSLNFSDLYKYIDADQFEFMLVNRCKRCLFSSRSIADWWIKSLFNASNLYQFDLGFLNDLEVSEKDVLSYYLDSLFEVNSNDLKLNKTFKEFNDFFDIDDNRIDNIDLYKKSISQFYEFKNSVKKQKENALIIKNDIENNLVNLSKYLKEEIVKYFDSLGFIDKSIDLNHEEAKGFYNLNEMFDFESSKSLYFDMIKNCFAIDFHQIFEDFFKNDFISLHNNINANDLSRCLKIKPTFSTERIMYVLQSKKNIDSKLKNDLEKLDEKVRILENNDLLSQYCYGNKDSIKFNYELHTFELKPLSEEDVLKTIDNYKSENGTYFYQGIQYSYDELISLLKRKLFTMKIYFKYKINYNKEKICAFDPWGFYERSKNRKKENC